MERKVIYIPEGIPNIQPLFSSLQLNDLEEWYLKAKDADGMVIATTRLNKMERCCEDIRIHFINSLGEIDSINFGREEQETDVKTDSWTKSLLFPLDRSKGGSYRQNIRSNEKHEVETDSYSEDDQYWVKEVFETPQAWLELNLPNGFLNSVSKQYIPIEILEGKLPLKKNTKRYEYLVKIKFVMSNSNINLR